VATDRTFRILCLAKAGNLPGGMGSVFDNRLGNQVVPMADISAVTVSDVFRVQKVFVWKIAFLPLVFGRAEWDPAEDLPENARYAA